MERKKYPIRAEDYELLEIVGEGGSASVHRARCVPLDNVVAVKILDFEGKNSDLSNISREAQTMILIDHPNVLNAHCSFVNDHTLWIVLPYMAGGSCLHIMKSAYPNGFDEAVIAFLLREVLKGLEYLHQHGHIHRDVKAGNILVDARHGVKLGDFGVSACLFDSGDRQRTRKTFVGTPCWMAPEVMEQLHGYDFKADIWSFGITALELAHGHAPFSSHPPMKVLLMTLQNAPPSLDYKRGKKFSKSFGHMIATCLVKDPSKRPSAQRLLKHPFFKQAKSHDSVARKILEGLPSLGDRFHALKLKEADLLAQKKMLGGEKEEISQNEYNRGISSWKFDIDDLKAQASMIPDEDTHQGKDQEGCSNSLFELDTSCGSMPQGMYFATSCSLKDDADVEYDGIMQNTQDILSSPNQTATFRRLRSDVSEKEYKVAGANGQHVPQNGLQFHGNNVENNVTVSSESENDEKHMDNVLTHNCHEHKVSTSSFSSDILPSGGDSVKQHDQLQNMENCNGGMCSTATVSNGDDPNEKSKAPVVQQRGRFKVTSENVDLDKALLSPGLPKSQSMQAITQLPTTSVLPSSDVTSNLHCGSLFEQLQSILRTNILQRDCILNMMKQVSTSVSSDNHAAEGECTPASSNVKPLSEREEQQLSQDITDQQLRLICTQEELQMLKAKNTQTF